jgi:heme-degrading monooxygenase HmoA
VILEHAVLEVIEGREEEFEAAFAQAEPIICGAQGCRGLRLERCLEARNRYLLLVEWDSLEAHTEGFRGSAAYGEWRALLHHFYEPFPTVEHYELARSPAGSLVEGVS